MEGQTYTPVITGMGLVTALGHEPEAVWSRLVRGQSAVAPLAHYPTGQGGATVTDFDPVAAGTPRRLLKMINRPTTLALAAARRAWQSAGLEPGVIAPERFGVYVGSGESEMQPEWLFPGLEEAVDAEGRLDLERFATAGLEVIDPYIALKALSNNALCYVSIAHDLKGPNNNYVKSGVAASQALGEAARIVRHGYADAVMVVGVDCLTDPLAVTAYNSVGLLAPDTAGIESAMRPFDRERRGFLPGEGAAALVLESEAGAWARGATVLGRVLGFGQATDAHHLLSTPLDGGQLPVAIDEALADAGLAAGAVDFVVAHGNATLHGDRSEAAGIAAAAGGGLRDTPVTATKPYTGHLGAASGVVESALALLMLRHQTLPPVLNLADPDPACRLPFVTGGPRDGTLRAGLHVARGIGGQNAVLVLGAA